MNPDIPPTVFKSFVETTTQKLPKILPLVHMTDCLNLRKILEAGKIEPKTCKHFSKLLKQDEPLSFFFYGKASYRSKAGTPANNDTQLPAALIIQLDEAVHSVKRIFPFDTGACFQKYYKPWLDSRFTVMDFFLGKDIDIAQKHVAKFFGTNKNYIIDKALMKVVCDAADFEIINYHHMLKNTANTSVDNRKSSIEIQIDGTIELKKTKILGAIIPDTQMSSKKIETLLTSFNTIRTPYQQTRGSTTECDGVLISKSIEIIRKFL
ncbi:hypothetical protein H8L32_05060 [Undibacterium sp. CY18W]|uniref:Uncharacterized protein n=1 Tax=Undibacterium hunanense TaxID=2762292 RepID=A0ABR6ZLS4_9BURK|nr:hypothetical protein [Undibacterium hunanense]MBC3916837.1 hypothetical protein [Undibacterium hunanense]